MSSRTIRAAATIVLAALLFSIWASPAGAAEPARHIVVVLAPYLTWDDVMHGPMPATRSVADRGLIANMNVRPSVAGPAGSALAQGAQTISAGASVVFEPSALSSYDASEPVGGWLARDLYRQRFGASPGGSAVLYLGQPSEQTANEAAMVDATLGSLGAAARDAGFRTVALGNSDPGVDIDAIARSRPAGIVAADTSGLVTDGDVSTGMLLEDPVAPFGVRTDLDRFAAVYGSAVADSSKSLVIVDPGDLSRAHDAAPASTARAASIARSKALEYTDQVVALVARGLDPRRDVLVLIAPGAQDVTGQPAALVPAIVSGPSGAGLATAASTHRAGIVTAMDVSASIVAMMGGQRRAGMVGSTIVRADGPSGSLASRAGALVAMNDTAVGVEVARVPLLNTYIALTVIVLLGSALIAYRGTRDLPASAGAIARSLLVLVVCVPLASVAQFAVRARPAGAVEIVLILLAVAGTLWVAALALGRGRAVTVPMIAITASVTVVFLADQWFGAPLSWTGLFGYSPLYGARYYGIGNEMAGLLLGAAMVAGALSLDTWPDAPWARHVRAWGWPLLGVIVLWTSASPLLGANIGTVAWMTVGFLVGWLMLNGRRVWSWRNVAIAVLIVVVLVAGLVAIDLLGGAGTETHIGRAVSDAGGAGGLAGLWNIIARKAETNARVLGRTNWTWLLLAVLLLLGYMRWRPRGEFAAMLKEYPAYSAALGAAMFAGVVGYFTEDSGIIIPALMMVPIGVTALYLMLARDEGGAGARRARGEAS